MSLHSNVEVMVVTAVHDSFYPNSPIDPNPVLAQRFWGEQLSQAGGLQDVVPPRRGLHVRMRRHHVFNVSAVFSYRCSQEVRCGIGFTPRVDVSCHT